MLWGAIADCSCKLPVRPNRLHHIKPNRCIEVLPLLPQGSTGRTSLSKHPPLGQVSVWQDCIVKADAARDPAARKILRSGSGGEN